MDDALKKYGALKASLAGLGRAAVAFSAGVDSALLLRAAHDALGENALAVTARHRAFPQREFDAARDLCAALGVRLLAVEFDELAVPGFAENPPDRCYLCKKALFGAILSAAAAEGFPLVCEGSNLDDEGDYRPGMRALAELGVKSPLREAGMNKAEIRALAKALGLPVWDKPAYACLATRIPYGETVTPEKLARIEAAENVLADLGFRQRRVRLHGGLARIELEQEQIPRLADPALRRQIDEALRALGFRHVTLDLGGYRTGGGMTPENG